MHGVSIAILEWNGFFLRSKQPQTHILHFDNIFNSCHRIETNKPDEISQGDRDNNEFRAKKIKG